MNSPQPDPDGEIEALRARQWLLFKHGCIGSWTLSLPAGDLTLSPQARQLLVGDADSARLGLADLLALVDVEDRSSIARAFEALVAGGRPIDLFFDVHRPPLGRCCLRMRGAPVPDASAARAEGTLQDVSERRQIEQALEQSRTEAQEAMARVKAVLEAVPDLWFVLSEDGRYMEVSRPDHPSLAAPWEQAHGRHFAEVVSPHVSELAAAALARARAGGSVERIEYRLATVGGADRSFEARITAMSDGRWLYLTRDITDALQAQQALRESEGRLARAMRGTSDGLWEWDVRTGRDHLSPRWKALLGFAPHELADAEESFFGRLHPDDVGAVNAAVQAHFRHGAPYDIELRLRTKDDQWRWFRSRGEVERDAAGQPLRMAGSISDITARRQIEDALRDSQARASAMLHTVPVGIALTGLDDGLVVEANDELGRILGWPAGEMVGRSTVELGVWAEPAQRVPFADALRREGRAFTPHVLLRHHNGSTVHGRLSSQLLDIGGQTLVLSALTDISDRVLAEQALREQREAYAAIFEAASDAIVSVDVKGQVLLFNPGAERIFGVAATALHGQSMDRLLPAAQRARHHVDIAGFSASASSRRAMGAGRVKGLRADGHELDLEASISKAQVGGQVVLTAILRDVTERVRAEADLLRHRFELSALTRQLLEQEKRTTQRLAQALHDQLGQTLTALRLALDRERRAPAADAADAALRSAQSLALVDEAVGQVRQVLVDLRPPLLDEEGLHAALDNEMAARTSLHPGIDLLLEVPPAAQSMRWPGEVEYALFMITREALDNALRHAGATLVRVAMAGDARGVQLEVVDDGVGFEPVTDRARPGHLGLIGMRERARAIGAVLELGTAAEGGTRMGVAWATPT
ncbi:PAS domain-containing sensor histidine kinase [Methyloversatilis sp.]|uniref:PAS domain-containing sensor histidine kinase n=1 Tax=Methyloversatilis sp. TaxID=2569862 RepID=UPI003F717158